jgi:hypothetical protein
MRKILYIYHKEKSVYYLAKYYTEDRRRYSKDTDLLKILCHRYVLMTVFTGVKHTRVSYHVFIYLRLIPLNSTTAHKTDNLSAFSGLRNKWQTKLDISDSPTK